MNENDFALTATGGTALPSFDNFQILFPLPTFWVRVFRMKVCYKVEIPVSGVFFLWSCIILFHIIF